MDQVHALQKAVKRQVAAPARAGRAAKQQLLRTGEKAYELLPARVKMQCYWLIAWHAAELMQSDRMTCMVAGPENDRHPCEAWQHAEGAAAACASLLGSAQPQSAGCSWTCGSVLPLVRITSVCSMSA